MCKAIRYIKELEDLLERLAADYEILRNKESEIDKEINKKYHELEVKNFNAVEGYYIAKNLQLALQKRRILKAEMKRMNMLVSKFRLLDMNKQISGIEKSITHQKEGDDKYTARFFEEAFEVLQ